MSKNYKYTDDFMVGIVSMVALIPRKERAGAIKNASKVFAAVHKKLVANKRMSFEDAVIAAANDHKLDGVNEELTTVYGKALSGATKGMRRSKIVDMLEGMPKELKRAARYLEAT